MWLFCCGMKRSGSTLQYQIASRLARDYLNARVIDWKPEKEVNWNEEESRGAQPLVYKCHRCTPEITARLAQTDSKGVYTYRDIRDVCGSWIRKHNSTFARLIRARFIQECLENFEQFTSMKNVLVSRYEDLVGNLAEEVRRIADHLSITLSEDAVRAIADDYQLDRQQQRIEQISTGSAVAFQYGDQLIDRQELLHSNHITDGRVNAWAEFFSRNEIAVIEDLAGNWMDQVGYARVTSGMGFVDRWRVGRFRKTLDFRNG